MYDVATQQTYNGWNNRETWLVNLWLTNDEGSQAILDEMAGISPDLYERVDWLEQTLRDQLPEEVREASLWSDLLSAALDHVSWYELAAWASN